MTHIASPMPSGASHGPRWRKASTKTIAANARHAAALSRCAAAGQSPLLPASQGPQRSKQSPPLPGEKRPERHGDNKRYDEGREGEIEEWRPDRNLVAGQYLERERIERAEKPCGTRSREQEIIEDEASLATDWGEQPALRKQRRPPGEQRERATDEYTHDGQDEDTARGIDGEGMHASQHARAHKEGPHQAQR